MKCLHFIVFVLTLFLLETANSLAEEFNITTAAGDTLSVDVENRDNISRGKLVFIQHGLATDRNHRVVQQTARAFADAGYVVVTFDSRHSLGKSGQDVENARLTTFEQDLEDVVSWAKTQDFYAEPFALSGHSLGGASVLQYAANHPKKTAVVVAVAPVISGQAWEDSCLANMTGFCKNWQKNGNYAYQYDGKEYLISYQTVEDAKNFDALKISDDIAADVLLIAAQNDNIIPPQDIDRLYEKLKSVKQMTTVADSGHNFELEENQLDLYNAVSRFLTTATFSEKAQ